MYILFFLVSILFFLGSCICQKTSHIQDAQFLFFLMDYSVFKFSNPKSLSAKMRSSSPKYSTPLKNYIKLYLPVHLQMSFALSYIWSVWDCCWTGAEAVHRPSRQQRNFFTSLMPKLKHLSVHRSDQLVFQSKWFFLQFNLFWKLGMLSNIYVLRPLGIWTIF